MSDDIKLKYEKLEHPAMGRKEPKVKTLEEEKEEWEFCICLLYTSPSPRDS